ncbi:hypothetical protein DL767_000055 [Monosporascus sp. MG133]|nr:hypothetical protein DL767_000055 [Monosporascus sp. MG133]
MLIRQALRDRAFPALGTNHPCRQFFSARWIPEPDSDEAVDILRAWLCEPLLVPAARLCRVLDIRHSTSASPPLSSGSVCYFRSWTLLAPQLQEVVKDLAAQGFPDEDVREWRLILQTCSGDTVVTPRYIGTTSGPSNPWMRTRSEPDRPNSLKGAFIKSLEFLFPEAAKSHKVFAINNTFLEDLTPRQGHATKSTATAATKASRFLSDQTERAAIGYFQARTLLNHQTGGKRTALDSNIDEMCDLKKFGQKKAYQPYIQNCIQQALPVQFKGITLAVICGEEPPFRTLRDGSLFWSGERASGEFVTSILRSIEGIEQDAQRSSIEKLQSIIGFNQLYNWPGPAKSQRDPSRDEEPDAQHRVVWLSWVYTWVYLDAAVKALDELGPGTDRVLLFDLVRKRAENVLEQAGYHEALNYAKKALSAAWSSGSVKRPEHWNSESEKRRRETTLRNHQEHREGLVDRFAKKRKLMTESHNPERETFDAHTTGIEEPGPMESLDNLPIPASFSILDYVATLERCGIAEGPPQSDQRRQQARHLFQSWVPARYGQTDEATWVNFILEQPEATMGIKFCFTIWQNAIQRISEELMTSQMRWLEATHQRGQKLLGDVPRVEELDGHRVNVNQHGLVTIKYRKQGASTVTIQIKLGSSVVPRSYLDGRTVHFTPNSVDIRNQQGVTLHTRGKAKQATIPVADLPAMVMAGNLSISGSRSPAWGLPVSSLSLLIKEDALWLLNEYLNQELPEGGDFWTGEKENFPMRPESAIGSDTFLQFLKSSMFCHHPIFDKYTQGDRMHREARCQPARKPFAAWCTLLDPVG